MRRVSAGDHVVGVKINKHEFYSNPSICPICAVCKMTRRSFKKNSHRKIGASLYSLVYTDVEGPIQPVGFGGIRYIVSFICSRSRFKHIHFMMTKDEVLEKLKVFKSQEIDAHGFKLCEVLSDGGGEYIGD